MNPGISKTIYFIGKLIEKKDDNNVLCFILKSRIEQYQNLVEKKERDTVVVM